MTSALTLALILEGPPPPGTSPLAIIAIVSFGWLSAAGAIVLYLRRQWSMKQSHEMHRNLAAGVWFRHVAFFIAMLVSLLP